MKSKFMPKSEDVFKVANILESVVPLAPYRDNLNMTNCFSTEELCGTSCCHGGWYAIASGFNISNKKKMISFIHGASKLAMDLGFVNIIPNKEKGSDLHNNRCMLMDSLSDWAQKNPTIWGNMNGNLLFSVDGKIAFISEKRPTGADYLQDIVDHWREVGERLKLIEERNKPKYQDITSKLAKLPVDETSDCKIKELI